MVAFIVFSTSVIRSLYLCLYFISDTWGVGLASFGILLFPITYLITPYYMYLQDNDPSILFYAYGLLVLSIIIYLFAALLNYFFPPPKKRRSFKPKSFLSKNWPVYLASFNSAALCFNPIMPLVLPIHSLFVHLVVFMGLLFLSLSTNSYRYWVSMAYFLSPHLWIAYLLILGI